MTHGNEPSTPIKYEQEVGDRGYKEQVVFTGLTKREYFAAMALSGLCTRELQDAYGIIPQAAVTMADELIKALNK